VPFDIIIIPNLQQYVKKLGFLTRIVLFGIYADKGPDFICGGAALFLKV